MMVRTIRLEGFRNYAQAAAEFSDGTNILLGSNGQGKTNLLEAIFYLTGARSMRTRADREVIGFGREQASIDAEIFAADRAQTLSVRLARGRPKALMANGVRLRTASEFAGRFTAVLFSPEDLYMIRDGAAVRRRLMDVCLSQLRPRYAKTLTEYNRIYEHKTRILRDRCRKPALLDALPEFNRALAAAGAELIRYRAHFAKKLARRAAAVHREFSSGAEELGIRYVTVGTVADPLGSTADIFEALLVHQQAHREAELNCGLCLSGAHKDDLEILINGVAARSFASQGQTRTAVLSIKLAERMIHFEDRGEHPVLLLDDVLSELDAGRRDFVLNHISDGQVFITCCEEPGALGRTEARLLHIENGKICG